MSLFNVVAEFEHPSAAQDALNALVEAGFDRSQIGLVAGASEEALRRRRLQEPDEYERAVVPPDTGAAMGFALGFLGGGFLGLLLGSGALELMGRQPAMAVGPFWAAAIGAVVLGLAGGLAGYLFNAPLPRLEPATLENGLSGPRIPTVLNLQAEGERAAEAGAVVGRFGPERVAVWRPENGSWVPA